MTTTKATLVASRVTFIEAALARMKQELETAEGAHREALQKWVVAIHQALLRHGHQTLH
jgi:hypothetical protein